MITVVPLANDAFTIIIDSKEHCEAFKELVHRGANLWPDAIPEIKEFADKMTDGKVLQDYKGQDTSRPKCKHEYPEVSNRDFGIIRCLKCDQIKRS